jgi:ABC-type antimicrobial peptide transport system permease subunit
MREERITINILNWLEENGWQIVCYDFPQSGTGILLHPNGDNRTEKNKGGIIPDIIAVKDSIALFFENKDRFYQPDFDKLFEIKNENNFSDSLNQLLSGFSISKIVYGIGIPEVKKHIEKSKTQLDKIDFLISTNDNKNVEVHYDIEKVL